jgi:hypothetical protein
MQRLANLYIDIPALRPGTVGAYVFAFLCAALATTIRIAIDPYVDGVPFITFFPAVIITTLVSGFGAGLFLRCVDRRCGRSLRGIAALVFLQAALTQQTSYCLSWKHFST